MKIRSDTVITEKSQQTIVKSVLLEKARNNKLSNSSLVEKCNIMDINTLITERIYGMNTHQE